MLEMGDLFLGAARILGLVAGCGDDEHKTDDFSLDGRFTLVMSGSEAGEPFESVGVMFLSTEGNVVSGEWRFDEAPVSVISGTVSGQITGNDFDFYNWTIPTQYGVEALVAPFWDNLNAAPPSPGQENVNRILLTVPALKQDMPWTHGLQTFRGFFHFFESVNLLSGQCFGLWNVGC